MTMGDIETKDRIQQQQPVFMNSPALHRKTAGVCWNSRFLAGDSVSPQWEFRACVGPDMSEQAASGSS